MTTTTTTTTIDHAAAEAHELANAAAWRATELELELEIDDATQWATIYRGARPIATAERRRVLDKSSPDWTIYTTDGRKLFELMNGTRNPAARIKRRMAAHLVDQLPTPREEAEPSTRFLNHYTCDRCGHDWQDEWDCMVDDECPACGARHMSPHTSEEIEAD